MAADTGGSRETERHEPGHAYGWSPRQLSTQPTSQLEPRYILSLRGTPETGRVDQLTGTRVTSNPARSMIDDDGPFLVIARSGTMQSESLSIQKSPARFIPRVDPGHHRCTMHAAVLGETGG